MIDWFIFAAGFSLVAGGFAFIACITILARIIGALMPKDSSDGKERSGFTIKTDALTGVQYLLTRQGHVVVRVDSAGYPVTEKKTNG